MQKFFPSQLFCFCIFCLLSFQCVAQEDLPKFEDFPAPPVTTDQTFVAAKVDLQSHPKANQYRTHLREAVRRGANFAGRYTLVSWGCGSNCLTVAIIDTTTGAVYFPPELAFLGVGLDQFEEDSALAKIGNQDPLTYRQNSNLLVVVGHPTPDGESRKDGGVFYYAWENNRLILIAQNNIITPKTLP